MLTMSLHNAQKLHNNFRAGPDKNLAFASLFRVVDRIERIIQDTCSDHGGGIVRFSTRL